MSYYYYLNSDGPDTNLQLYSLHQAKRYWRDLRFDYLHDGDKTADLKERCVFVVAVMGLSISQLLGQNPVELSGRVDFPVPLFERLVDHHGLDSQLKQDFQKFNTYYNACRHFGRTVDGSGYERIDSLDYKLTEWLYNFGVRVWMTVIQIYAKDEGIEFEEFVIEELSDDDF